MLEHRKKIKNCSKNKNKDKNLLIVTDCSLSSIALDILFDCYFGLNLNNVNVKYLLLINNTYKNLKCIKQCLNNILYATITV